MHCWNYDNDASLFGWTISGGTWSWTANWSSSLTWTDCGVTSNPSIFEKAVDDSTEYDEALRLLFGQDLHLEARAVYDALSIEDVRKAAGVLRPAHKASGITCRVLGISVRAACVCDRSHHGLTLWV